MEKTQHEQYIDELFDPRQALTPREVAAREEIAALRKQLEEKPAKKPTKSKVTDG